MSNQYYSPSGFQVLPPVVKNILIINVLFFLATLSLDKAFHIDLVDLFGLHYFAASKFQPYQIITYMFMHGGFSHIFFNMFAVWMFGNVLESHWGPKRFIIYYLITGFGAALTHYVIMYYFELAPIISKIDAVLSSQNLQDFHRFVHSEYFRYASDELVNRYNTDFVANGRMMFSKPDQELQSAVFILNQYRTDFLNAPVVIGASGAVFGILLAFGMMFPNSLLYIYFAFPIKAKWFVILYAGLELYLGVTGRGSNVAHFAHLGGMVFGLGLILLWRKRKQLY